MTDSNQSDPAIAQQGVSRALEELTALLEKNSLRSRIFPGGITKIAVTAKAGTAELSLTIEGTNSAPPAGREIELLAAKRVSISFGPNGEGTFSYDGKTIPCLGRSNLKYAKDLTVTGAIDRDKFRKKYSNEFNVWMEFAILIMGDRGIYIHEGDDTIATNGGESAGCIHLAPGNAEAFWNWVSGPTRITIDYPW
ncbi:L,D-transpeptidase [Methylobacterium sp. A52T]